MWRIRNFLTNIKNLIVWFPVIWKDRQWDSYYIEKILLKKLQLMIKYHESRNFFEGVENEIKWMKKCEYLLIMLVYNKYWEDKWDNKKPNRRGFNIEYTKNVDYLDHSYKVNIYADLWENKARVLFWKIFIWRYEYWWD